MRVSSDLYSEMVEHALEDAPNECCGIVAARNGDAVRVERATNIVASPFAYEIEPRDLFRITTAIDDAGEDLGAIYHSHTRSEPYPSQTDINLARNWPDPIYIIVGVKDRSQPEIRAFRIREGSVQEVELEVG